MDLQPVPSCPKLLLPQVNIYPLLERKIEWYFPVETLVTWCSLRGLIFVGRRIFSRAMDPKPSWPYFASPHE